MHPLYEEFLSYLNHADKENCVRFALSHLDRADLDIVTLYKELLTPAQNEKACRDDQQKLCIWEEHLRTSIVRTIIECCYPYLIREREHLFGQTFKGKAVVLCPPGESHEIGARMVADFFTLSGFQSYFIGANTPQDDIIDAIKYTRPAYVAISITTAFNLVAVGNAFQNILGLKTAIPFQVILGGQACQQNLSICHRLGADLVLQTFEEIHDLSENQTDVIS